MPIFRLTIRMALSLLALGDTNSLWRLIEKRAMYVECRKPSGMGDGPTKRRLASQVSCRQPNRCRPVCVARPRHETEACRYTVLDNSARPKHTRRFGLRQGRGR